MNEDLHDIDDLFRHGLEAHQEEVSADAWQSVCNELDKKQASYYKYKYNRLKYAAAFLLLLCVLGAAYVTVDLLNSRSSNEVKKAPGPTTETVSSPPENSRPASGAGNSRRDLPQEVVKSGEGESVGNPSSGKQSVLPSVGEETAKQTKENFASANADGPVSSVPTSAIGNTRQQSVVSTGKTKFFLEESNDQKPVTTQFQVAAKEVFDLKHFDLPAKDFSLPEINPQAFFQNPLLRHLQQPSRAKSKAGAAHGFALSAFIAPNLSFDRLEDDDHLAGPGRNRREDHHNEEENSSFSGGLLISYGLTPRLRFQSGVTVTASSTSIAPKTVYAKADNNGHTRYELHCSSGYVYISPKGGVPPVVGDSARTSGTTSKLFYVGIPAAVQYEVRMGRLSLSPTIGAGLNILASGKTSTRLSNTAGDESTTAAISGLKSSYVDGQLGMGIAYELRKRLSISLRPNARLALTPINRETPVKSYQNYLSVETGLRIKL